MTRTFSTICACCGELFQSRSVLAAYCHVNCRRRARYYRGQGRAIPPKGSRWTQPIRPAVVHPGILPAASDASLLEVREWHGTPIQRRPTDGYVNATAMCKANGKRWHDFRSTAQCEAYTQALAAETGISGFALVDSQRGGDGAGGSTWIHPDLGTELARWISPAFSVFVNRWFRSELEAQARPTQPQGLPNGVHVIADNPRQAAWLWATAVEAEVSAALSRSTIAGRRLHPVPTHYQLHLLQA